jgi:vacuolar-type H+-ATPase subunit I/STV1
MGTPTSVYPPDEQRERWEQRADELDMSVASFVAAMTEAGMKKFERDIEPDHTRAELKAQRADLLDELNQARERIERLEDIAYKGERQAILNHLEENPGAEYHQILSKLQQTVGGRLTDNLDFLQLESRIQSNESGQYFLVEDDEDEES